MIEIKDIKGNVIYSTPINKGSKRKFELMQADHITLIFSLDTPINFPIGCYVDDSSIGLFERVDNAYKPKYNSSTGGYDYELQLDAYYRKWQNKIFKFTPEVGGQEASWSLTASLDVQMGIFLRNLKALGYTYRGTEFEFSIDATVENKAISMAYENMNMLDALSAMAESWECEWWVTDNVIHFGRCEYGTSVDFELNVNVAEMTRSESKSQYATRIYAFGSTKNLPTDYRPVDETVVVNGVVQRRLMLPEGTPYVNAYEGLTEEEAIEQVVVFEDIYPRTQGSIDSVETYDSTVENEDGTTTTETFYRFKDSGITFSEDYILEGEELRIKFESGSLNGMEFGLAFNPTGASEKLEDGSWNSEAQLFEIVASEDYGRKLPDSTLKPQAGDTYILIGWDSTKIADLGLVSNAENELLDKTRQYVEKSKVDPNTYQCKMMSDYMYGLDDEGNLDTNYAKVFEVGDKVKLINEGFFENGRQSRIIGYEYNLDYPYDNPIYTVGETASYSRIGDIESKLDALTYAGQTYNGVGGSGVYVIGTNDNTVPSNRNVYSALKSDQRFLRKDKEDTAKKKITFEEGINVGEFVSGASGASLFKDLSTGQTIMELDKLYVRMKAYFETLTIVEAETISGKQIVSPAGSVRCTNVEEYDDYYRCYFLNEQDGEKIENKFIEGDQAYSQMFNAETGTGNKISNRYYWRLVTGVGENYIDLSKTDCDADSDAPAVGDVLNQRGHRYPENSERMNFIETSTVDGFSPSITLFHGVNSFSLSGKDYVQFGVDKTTNRAFMNVYGDMYVGDRNQTAYIRYTQEDGLELCGKLAVGTKLGDKDLQELIDSATPEGYQEFVVKITQDIEGLQNQIDGAIESFFYQYEPSLTNYPASEWIAEGMEESHLNDTFTNLVDGRSWRWTVADDAYSWTEITDTATTQALALAGKAQDTADGKRRVFVDTPTPPYDKGDLWARGSDYPLLICVNPKSSGTYAEGDFDYADNNVKLKEEVQNLVTDTKSELNNAIGQAKDEAINNANNYTDEGKKALQASIDAMEEAKANVVDVYSKSEADGKISESEERALKAAQDEADAAIVYYDTIVKAYADGTATEEELAEIAGAKAALDAAKAYAEEQAKAAQNEIKNSYLFKALTDAQDTTIDNGLVLTSLIQLRDTDGSIKSGINGLMNDSKGDKSIANWWGGIMEDMTDYYTWNGTQWVAKSGATIPSNLPKGLIRMDGTGYLANGKFWWDNDGKIYADPTALFLSFDVDAEEGTLSATILDIRDKQVEFTNMWSLEEDSNGVKYLYSKYPLVSQGGVTMYAGTSGLDLPSIYDGLPIDGTTIYWDGGVLKAQGGVEGAITDITQQMVIEALGFTPYDSTNPNGYVTSDILDGFIAALQGGIDGLWARSNFDELFAGHISSDSIASDIANVGILNADTIYQNGTALNSLLGGYQSLITSSNKLSALLVSGLADVATSGSYNDLLNKPTLLSSFTNDLNFITNSALDGYATQSWVSQQGYLTSHQTIYDLTLQAGAFSTVTFDPNGAAATVNIPTTTSHISEGGNLYFTDARAVNALDGFIAPLQGQIDGLYARNSFDELFIGHMASDSIASDIINAGTIIATKIGIGTTSPSYTMHVVGDMYSTSYIRAMNGIYVNDIPVTKFQEDVLYIDANLVVRGGVTMYGTDTTEIPSILDSLPVASTTAKGIAQFSSSYFTVSNGTVSLIEDNVGLNETKLASYLSANNYTQQSDIPTSLKNPYALVINGISYDGSAAKTVDITASGIGALTEVTSSMITDALGYTPYSSGNPKGYVDSSALDGFIASLQGQIDGLYTRNSFDELTVGHIASDAIASDIANIGTLNATTITYNGYSVYYSGAINALKTDLGLGSNAYTSTTYLPSSSYTAADVLAKLLTVDGSGSGLDADTLDGAQPSALNVLGASKLTTARTLWGQSFDGTGNVSGALSGVTTISASGNITTSGTLDAKTIYQNGTALDSITDGFVASLQGQIDGLWTRNSFDELSVGHLSSDGIASDIINAGTLTATKLGVGTTSPSYTLDVAGSLRSNSTIYGSSFGFTSTSTSYGSTSIELYGSTPFIDFHYNSSTSDYTSRIIEGLSGQLTCTGKFRVGLGYTTSTDYALHVVGSGYISSNLLTGGGITMYSARVLKNIVNEDGLTLKELSIIKPTRYTWKDKRDDRLHIGGIADDIEQVLPEVVYKTNEGILTMDYGNAAFAIASSLIKPVINHEERIARLERENRELREEVKRLKN